MNKIILISVFLIFINNLPILANDYDGIQYDNSPSNYNNRIQQIEDQLERQHKQEEYNSRLREAKIKHDKQFHTWLDSIFQRSKSYE